MGGKNSTSTSTVKIPPEVLARYNAVNARAEAAATTPYEAFGKTASDYVAQMNAQQNAGIADINATAGSYQPYMDQATTATQAGMGPAYAGIDNYMSPYIKNVADTTGAYMRQQQEQAQSGALGNAVSSGAFGGDRAGIAAANLQQQNQMGYGKTMADIYNQGYTQALGASQADLARQLAGGAQLAGLGAQSQQLGLQGAQAKIAAGTMQQQTEQAGKDAMINQFMQEKGYPFQIAQFLANIAMGTGAASGSTTSTTTPRNWLGFASGGVAGPRTYTQSGVGGEGYVPAGDLPVGQMMIADPPEQKQGGMEDILKLIAMMGGGAKNGGAIDRRHGYALDGGVSYPALTTEELRREQEIRKQLAAGTGIIGDLNKDALKRAPLNPANMGLAGRPAPESPTVVSSLAYPQPLRWKGETANGLSYEAVSTKALRNRPEKRQNFSKRMGLQNDEYLASSNAPLTPANMGVAGRDMPQSPTSMASLEALAPTTSSRPPARPAGLGAADAMTTSPRPMPRPTGVAGADVADDAMATLGTTVRPETSIDPVSGLKTINVGATPMDIPTGVKPIHLATGWDTFGPQVSQRESGGDYDALFGFSNREGGRFEGKNVTEMTIDEALEFANPSGAYGQWVAQTRPDKENGVATPMGAYQIVGKTLRGIKEGMGLTGDELMTPELQDKMAKWLYDNYGESHWAASASKDGLAGADMTRQRDGLFTNNKPYEQRNAIGKFFYDPNTGKLDKNALLSVLMGVGKAAEAQTISPLGGILSGIGGGAEAYKGLVKQQADVAATNIDNMRNIQMDTMTYNEMNGTNLTPQQYASMIGASYQIPMGIGQPIGGDKMTWNEYQNGVVQVGGRSVKMQDDPVSIQKFISDNSMFPAESPIGKQVAEARLHLNDINNSGGMTIDVNGQQFQIPGYTEVGNVQAKTVADQEAAAAFRAAAGDALNSSAQQLAAVKTLESVYTKMEPGKFANVGAEASAILSALDPSDITGWQTKYDLTNPAQYEIALKGAGEIMATRLRSMPGGAPSAEIDMLSTVTPTPNMQPEAVKKLLAITKADAQYRFDMYNNYDPAVHGNDVNAYMKQFADGGKTFTRYVEEAMASMPRFAGEGIEPSAAEAELIRRGYKYNSEGKLVKP